MNPTSAEVQAQTGSVVSKLGSTLFFSSFSSLQVLWMWVNVEHVAVLQRHYGGSEEMSFSSEELTA